MAHRLKSSGRSRDQPILLPNLPPNLVTLPGPQRLAVIAYARAGEGVNVTAPDLERLLSDLARLARTL
jgi:hypothetical protein